MGVNDHVEKPKSGKGGRGSVNNTNRLAGLRGGDGKASTGDWGGCDPRWLQALIVAVSSRGGAVSFGLSRDKGAHSCTIMLDGDRATLWFNGDADLDEELEKVYEYVNTL